MMERIHFRRGAEDTEGMKIALAQPTPVAELDTELEGRTRLAHEVRLVQAKRAVEQGDGWNRRFTDSDRADVRGLDHLDGIGDAAQFAGQQSRRHPAGRAAAHDCDAADGSRGAHAECRGCAPASRS